jgi:hypothetical protein
MLLHGSTGGRTHTMQPHTASLLPAHTSTARQPVHYKLVQDLLYRVGSVACAGAGCSCSGLQAGPWPGCCCGHHPHRYGGLICCLAEDPQRSCLTHAPTLTHTEDSSPPSLLPRGPPQLLSCQAHCSLWAACIACIAAHARCYVMARSDGKSPSTRQQLLLLLLLLRLGPDTLACEQAGAACSTILCQLP